MDRVLARAPHDGLPFGARRQFTSWNPGFAGLIRRCFFAHRRGPATMQSFHRPGAGQLMQDAQAGAAHATLVA
jgi:hypothetical protein